MTPRDGNRSALVPLGGAPHQHSVDLLDPLREQFLALLPVRHVVHPLGCHRPRIDDRIVFDKLVEALVFGAGYERIAGAVGNFQQR
jgi:hypothetical protein